MSLYSDPAFVERTVARGDVEAVEVLEGVYRSLTQEWPQNWTDCVSWARKRWETLYNNDIRQLLQCFPPDQVILSSKHKSSLILIKIKTRRLLVRPDCLTRFQIIL